MRAGKNCSWVSQHIGSPVSFRKSRAVEGRNWTVRKHSVSVPSGGSEVFLCFKLCGPFYALFQHISVTMDAQEGKEKCPRKWVGSTAVSGLAIFETDRAADGRSFSGAIRGQRKLLPGFAGARSLCNSGDAAGGNVSSPGLTGLR
jgi:hypothetical protein